jgi:hypothetical protein
MPKPADRPGAQLALLKMLRVLIHHARSLKVGDPLKLSADPSEGIPRPKGKEIRAWTDAETAAFEGRWPIGTKQRTAYALMLYVGTARVDVHRMTWTQFEAGGVGYTRNKTGVAVDMGVHTELQRALAAADRSHVTIINTAYGRPFTVGGFSQFMRNAIRAAGLPLDSGSRVLRLALWQRPLSPYSRRGIGHGHQEPVYWPQPRGALHPKLGQRLLDPGRQRVRPMTTILRRIAYPARGRGSGATNNAPQTKTCSSQIGRLGGLIQRPRGKVKASFKNCFPLRIDNDHLPT